MAKQQKLQKIANSPLWRRWFVQAFLGLLAAGVAYALASYAIDSGSLIQWVLCIFWLGTAFKLYAGLAARLFRCLVPTKKEGR